ncbi:MAG TPA: sugar transferase [Candidatus Aminicenantes bacterium]|nr:sugar transferase [Candidatus Aminicenantes bacterium]HRY65743.1 sugar transferase [Candidatus Aminicenantes bacterium]HRZ72657.1 sugar transferase [Candidatus Aminicenantes bacterium]
MDIALALPALAALLPLLLVIALAIRLTMGRGVVYKQVRPGRRARPFEIWKFRTMREIRDERGGLAPDDVRLTGFGNWLRRTSLDELPELANVVRGDMSIVGPRPLLTDYLGRYSAEQARRHEVKPGITGWAQVNGRNAITWEEKFRCDVWYVDHVSLWTDVRIIALTLVKVFAREGISHENHVTMPGFQGTKE